MCLFYRANFIFLAIGVSTLLGAKLSEEQKSYVDLHNTYRSKASFRSNPPASNMKKMEWNSTLETLAKKWASNCTFEHGQPANTINEWIGQNLYLYQTKQGAPDNLIAKAVEAWHSEVSDYNFKRNTCRSVCGHYTQVMWANSYKVGCAVSPPNCRIDNNQGFRKHIVVCNYLPGGNWEGQKPYIQGASCSQCETAWQGGCDNHLCTRGDGQGNPVSKPMKDISEVFHMHEPFADKLQEVFKPT